MRTISKKLIAFVCTFALVITSNIGIMQTSISAEDTVKDITVSQAIGDYGTVESYQYRSAWLENATSDYKYMIITYTGNIAPLRIEGNFKEGYTSDGVVYWMDQSFDTTLKLVGSNPVLNSETETKVIVDIEATGLKLDELTGLHMHYGPGTLNIIDVVLTATIPEDLIEDISLTKLVGTYGTDTSSAYAYKEEAFTGALSIQKYLLLSFVGNAKRCRFSFYNAEGKIGTELWVDESQSSTPLSLVGHNPVLSTETETTVVVDLEASGISAEELTKIRIHSDGQPFEVIDCKITATIPADLIEDIVLSKIVGVYGTDTSSSYTYKEESFSGALATQKYLVISFVGDAKRCRLGFYDATGKIGAEKWVDKTQSSTPLTLIGDNPVLSSEKGATVVVDLEASGVAVDELIKIRAHSESQPFEITDFRLTATLPEIEEPTEEETTTEAPTIATYTISVDGTVVATVEEGTDYTLPTDATYGYYDGTAMYKAGATIAVTADVAFTSVNELAVTVAQGAGIKIDGITNGIRFQATVTSDNMAAVKSDAITEGMLITAEDLYTEFGNSVLDLDSTYAKIKVDNEGWFMEQDGVYCGSVVNIDDANCIRNFIARAYVTINYADGTSEVVYSDMSGARSISGVAKAIIAAGHLANFDADAQAIISAYAEY